MSHELLIELGLITARPHIHTHWIIQSGRSINQMTTFYIMYTIADAGEGRRGRVELGGLPAGRSNFAGPHVAHWHAPGSANWRQGRRKRRGFTSVTG